MMMSRKEEPERIKVSMSSSGNWSGGRSGKPQRAFIKAREDG